MICKACKNKITSDSWIRITVDCMTGAATVDLAAPNYRLSIYLNCVGLLDVCMKYLTDPEFRADSA